MLQAWFLHFRTKLISVAGIQNLDAFVGVFFALILELLK